MLKIFFHVVERKILENVSFFTCNHNKDGLFRLEHRSWIFGTLNFKKTQNDLKKFAVESMRRLFSVKISPKLDSAKNVTVKKPIWRVYRLTKGFNSLV